MERISLWKALGEWAGQLVKIGSGISILLLMLAALTDYTPLRNKISDVAGVPELVKNVHILTENTQQIDERLKKVETVVKSLDENGLGSKAAAIKFMENGHSITDAKVGESVIIRTRYINLRDCGRPKITAWFKNGRKIPHLFQDVSIVGPDGRIPASKADPQEVVDGEFIAWIPNDDAVTVGNAYGWVEVGDYEFCPNVPVASSPQIPFTIINGNVLPRERG